MKKLILIIYITAGTLILTGCNTRKEILFTGRTMGTTYRVKVVAGYFQSTSGLQEKIDKRLDEINRSMSTYLADSEISRLNRLEKTGEKFAVSDDFLQVMRIAEKIHALSNGTWDGTVGPLVNLWGFGRKQQKVEMPSSDEIQTLLAKVGFNRIKRVENRYLLKSHPRVTLDFGSIAKGYGVDEISALIRNNGFKDFLVEIGGEVYAAGVRVEGNSWRVGVNTPQKDAPIDQVYKVVNLKNKAMATSGDYRNFIEIGGKRYSHVIDPRTGYPVANGVVSVSIIADTCTFADGFATAVMVMGHEKGLDLVNRIDRVEGLIIVRENGKLVDYYSKDFLFDTKSRNDVDK